MRAKTFEDLLKTPTIDGLQAAVTDFPAVVQDAVLQGFDRDASMAQQKALIKEALERIKANRDPLAKVSTSRPTSSKNVSSDNVIGLEAPSAARKIPPKKDDSHTNLSPPLDIIAPTIGRGARK
jgi:hypothetical protein